MIPLLNIMSMAVSTASLAKQKDFIQDNWRFILGIGATIGVTYVVWSIYSDWKDGGNKNPTSDLTLKENAKLPSSTLTDSEALSIANRLQNAMGTWGMADEEERATIKSLLTGLTYNDYIKVSKFFGQRGYITITGISKDSDFLAPKKNLSYWLSKELPEEDFVVLRKILPGLF